MTQGKQMTRQVAAVDRRDVRRRQHFKGFRVVPVIEMSAIPRHPCQRRKSRLQPVERVVPLDPFLFQPNVAAGGQFGHDGQFRWL